VRILNKIRCVWVLSVVTLACASPALHQVDRTRLDAVRGRTFDLGIVKVAGGLSFPFVSDSTARKQEILMSLPVEAICEVLSREYGLRIRAQEERPIKFVSEELENSAPGGSIFGAAPTAPVGAGVTVTITPGAENPYWGSKEYRYLGFFESLFSFQAWGTPVIADASTGDFIYLKYAMRIAGLPFDLQEEFFYELRVRSDGKDLIQHRGMAAQGDVPKYSLMINLDQVWSDFESHAATLVDVIERDIRATKQSAP